MYIIKITPHSFKVILSKNDLEHFGERGYKGDNKIPKAFLGKILKKAKNEYGFSDFGDCVEAEFFESKDGGGELFVNSFKTERKMVTYVLSTNEFENIVSLCKRYIGYSEIRQSRLLKKENLYMLVLFLKEGHDFLLSGIGEYGKLVKVSAGGILRLSEYGKMICKNKAIQCIAHHFR